MEINFEYPTGATPLEQEEIDELITSHITIQAELNQWKQSNIHDGLMWINASKKDILSEKTLLALHKKMFDKTWEWAGKLRYSNKNIGVDKSIISMELRKLLDDVKYQIEHHTYSLDEIGARFHHRLVQPRKSC